MRLNGKTFVMGTAFVMLTLIAMSTMAYAECICKSNSTGDKLKCSTDKDLLINHFCEGGVDDIITVSDPNQACICEPLWGYVAGAVPSQCQFNTLNSYSFKKFAVGIIRYTPNSANCVKANVTINDTAKTIVLESGAMLNGKYSATGTIFLESGSSLTGPVSAAGPIINDDGQ